MTKYVNFELSFSEPQAHYVDVQMTLEGFDDLPYTDIIMPVWAPGSYLIREYSKNVERFAAVSPTEEKIPFKKINKNTWRVYGQGKHKIIITYSVYGFEVSVRTSFIDASRAFLSPVGTFMYVDGYLDLDTTVKIIPHPTWHKISTGLAKTEEANTFYASNFDILFDAPIEIGNQDTWTFEVEGVLHECAMVGVAEYDREQLTQDITTIVKEENRIWGSNPNSYYLFVTHHHQNAYGGLEHLNSTILATNRFAYAQPTTYKNYLALVAHEYFHLWHVKRLRPKALGPFDYTQENYTTGLWVIEGFTSYYDNLIVRRCGFFDEDEYLQALAIDFNTVYNRPGHTLQSAAAASFDTWIKHYRPDENSHNVSISYYNKGAMHAAALDIKIIAETNGKKRLDDVLRAAYQKFYLIENRGFEEDELLTLAEEVTGVSLKEIFEAAHSTEELDYNRYFNAVGYQMVDTANHKHLSLGIKTEVTNGITLIKTVDRNSSAWDAGLNVGDELIAIKGYRIEPNNKAYDYILSTSVEGEKIPVLIARDGLVHTLEVELRKSQKKSFEIQRLINASAEQRRLGNIWLSS